MDMKMLNIRILEVKLAEIIESWYTERGRSVPDWKQKRNDQWFKDYCEDLEDDEHF